MKTLQRFVSAFMMLAMILGNVPLARADDAAAPSGLSLLVKVPDNIQAAHDKMKGWIEPVCVPQSDGTAPMAISGDVVSDVGYADYQNQMAAAMQGAGLSAKDRGLVQQGNQVVAQVQKLLNEKYGYSQKRVEAIRADLSAEVSDSTAIGDNFSAAQNKKGQSFNAQISKNFCDKSQASALSAKTHSDAIGAAANEGVGETNLLINKFGADFYNQLKGVSDQMTNGTAQRKGFEACENSLLQSTRSSTGHDSNNYDYGTIKGFYQQLADSGKQQSTALGDFTTKGKDCSNSFGLLNGPATPTAKDGTVPPGGNPPDSGTNWGAIGLGAAALGGVGALGYFMGKGSGGDDSKSKSSNAISTTGTVTCPDGQYLSGSVCLTKPAALTDGVANGTDSNTSGTTTTAANLGTAQNLSGANTLGNGNAGSAGTAATTRGMAAAAGTSSGSSGSLGSAGSAGGGGAGTAASSRGLVASTGSSIGGGYGSGGGFGGGSGSGQGDAAQGGMSLNSVDPGNGGTRVRVWKMVNGKMQWVWEVKGGCQAMKSCNDRRSKILSEASGAPTAAPAAAAPSTSRGLTATNVASRSPASLNRAPAAAPKNKKTFKKPLTRQR